jgi:hypothetical protein
MLNAGRKIDSSFEPLLNKKGNGKKGKVKGKKRRREGKRGEEKK